jgi:flagellar assembly protein FliH
MKPSSTEPLVPRPRTSPDGEPAGRAAGRTDDTPQVRVVRFDRPLRTEAESIAWADPRIKQRIDDAARRAREEASTLGYAAGWAQGRQAAAEQARRDDEARAAVAARALLEQGERVQALLRTLGEAARQATVSAVPAWTELADAVADGALAITRAALGRELAAVDAEVADAVRMAVRTLAGSSEMTVHVHPRDLNLLRELAGEELPSHVRLAADPTVAPGAVVAATPVQRLLRDLPAAVARAEEVLRS